MKKINKEHVLHMALEDLDKKEEKKILSEINSKIDKLRAWEFLPEEIEKLDEIKKMQIEENTGTTSLIISIVTLVVSAVTLIFSTLFKGTSNDTVSLINMIEFALVSVCVILVIIYVCIGLFKTNKVSKRNTSHLRMRIAIHFYREELLQKSEEEADKE